MKGWTDWAKLALCVAFAILGVAVNLSCAHAPDSPCPPGQVEVWDYGEGAGAVPVSEGCVWPWEVDTK